MVMELFKDAHQLRIFVDREYVCIDEVRESFIHCLNATSNSMCFKADLVFQSKLAKGLGLGKAAAGRSVRKRDRESERERMKSCKKSTATEQPLAGCLTFRGGSVCLAGFRCRFTTNCLECLNKLIYKCVITKTTGILA